MGPANSYEAESHAIALARSRTRSRSRARAGSIAHPGNDKVKSLGDDESFDDDAGAIDERDFKHKQTFQGWLLFWLAYQSTGVIYGDIGTSPLYVYSSTFSSEPSPDDLLGALSLIIWSLTLIVTTKYVLIVLCADDEGEGGTFAIYTLLSRYSNIMNRDPKANQTVKIQRFATNELKSVHRSARHVLENSKLGSIILNTLAVFGVSLIMADGILTPAQSVLGAIQGLEVVAPEITTSTIVGVTCAILILLFLLQPVGITKLGSVFAPIVIIWMILNFSFGAYNLAKHDASVLKAFSPYFAGQFFARNKTEGWKSLGGILLAFTGVEALFADLGAFSKRAIQLSWLCFVYPCLLIAYIGQAAYIMDDPSAYSNPFFNSVPPGAFWPSLIISILAAIVASQAIITSTFQLLIQVMSTSYFPQIKAIYTSSHFFGQVYIPMANCLLMIGTVIVTAVYNNTTRLGHAYGVCVIMVTFITTCMVALVALIVWRINSLTVLAIFIPFITLDGLFLSSALTKVPDGAWFTILLAMILASIFILWRFGKEQQWASEAKGQIPTTALVVKDADGKEILHEAFGGREITKIKGLGIFFDKAGHSIPTVYAQFLQKFEARPDVHVFLQLRALGLPTVKEEEKYSVSAVRGIENCYRVVIRHGYNDEIVTKELGGVVCKQVQKYIIGVGVRRNRANVSFSPERPVYIDDNGVDTLHRGPEEVMVREEKQPNLTGEKSKLPPPDDTSREDSTITPIITAQDNGKKPALQPQQNDASTTSSSPLDADALTASKLAALDKAFETQVVYIVGKEQLRIAAPPNRSWTQYLGPPAFRRVVLGMFIWIRENTRAKVASMRIPVEKLVEVGFVKEI